MKVEYISNTGKDTVSALIKARSKTCSKLYLAVGFITKAGLNEITNSLRFASSRGLVKVLTGLYLGVTEPDALKELIKLESQKGNNFQSFIYNLKYEFHKKIYLFIEGKRFFVIIGSSNITSLGLTNEGEANVYIKGNLNLKTDKYFFNELTKDFTPERSEKLTKLIVKDYENQRNQYVDVIRKGIKINIKKILKLKRVKDFRSISLGVPNYYIDWINGNANKETEDIIHDETNWNNFNWYAIGYQADFLKKGDIIYLMDDTNNRFYPTYFKDYCKTKIKTPDGKYFVAFKPQKKFKKLNKNLRHFLRNMKITKGNISKIKKLTLKQTVEIGKLLG